MKFIFEVTVKPGYKPEQYARAWVEASQIIQQGNEARGTYLSEKGQRKGSEPFSLQQQATSVMTQEKGSDPFSDPFLRMIRGIGAHDDFTCS